MHTYPSGEDNSYPILPYPYALLLSFFIKVTRLSRCKNREVAEGFFMVKDWGRQKGSFSQVGRRV